MKTMRPCVLKLFFEINFIQNTDVSIESCTRDVTRGSVEYDFLGCDAV
jgi:hypothetical protein